MATHSYTEEEFKKVLKTLFAEKKRVKELQKRLDGRGLVQKFQNRLTDVQELTALKNAYAESERANSELRAKLEKLRPAVKKLVEELKMLQNQEPVSNHEEIAQIKAEAQEEKNRLLERIAESAGQLQQKSGELDALKHTVAQQAEALESSDGAAVRAEYEAKLEEAYYQMREMAKRNVDRLSEGEGKQQLEKELASAYTSLQSTKRLCEEHEAEVRKAQQHLAKKVKETAILRDLSDRQTGQIAELQEALAKQQQELEQVQSKLKLQQMHEEKQQVAAKERAQSAESLAKEWQEKFMNLQQEWRKGQEELERLRKVRENYDQMAATVESLKSILGKREES